MAYSLTCDWAGCGETIASGSGQPALSAKQLIYCPACAAIAAGVEARLHTEMLRFAQDGVDRLAARRDELMRESMPERKGGTGLTSAWPAVARG